jgi:hypothetical protein
MTAEFETVDAVVARWQRYKPRRDSKPRTRTRSARLSMSPNAVRSRDKRARRNRHEVCHTVTVGPEVYDLLVRLHWCSEADLADRHKVDAALTRLLQDTARR